MTNKKSLKRALVASSIALILCFTMLLGTTYAWFTDTVTSAGNIIKSGTLDIEMDWADGTEDPATTTAWADASQGAIFNYTLWEPGYVQVRHISIKNVGTLALKYSLNITTTGAASELADVIDVYFFDPATQISDRTALTDANKVGTLADVLAGSITGTEGELLPGEANNPTTANVTIALKMQETAGNEYQDKSIGTEFAIQLFATQLTYESDSFDNQYDVDAPAVDDADALIAALADGGLVKLGTNLTLGADTIKIEKDTVIDLNGFNLDASASTSRPFELTNGADLTINGTTEIVNLGKYGLVNMLDGASNVTLNGGNYVGNMDNGSFIKPRGNGPISITLNNVTLTDASDDSFLIDGSAYLGDELNITVNGGTYKVAAGIIAGLDITVKDATLNVQKTGIEVGRGRVATIENSTITVSGGAFNNAAPNACVSASDGTDSRLGSKAIIKNCTLNSDQHVFAIYSGVGCTIEATGCTINHTGSVDAYKIYNGRPAIPTEGTITVNGAVVAEQ